MITEILLFGSSKFSILSPCWMVVAELLYLLSLKKRKNFPLRLTLSLCAYLLFLLFVPAYNKKDFSFTDLTDPFVNAYATAYWLMVFWFSVLVFLPCFDVMKRNVLFCCSAGYCTQHLTAMLYEMITLPMPELSYFVDSLLNSLFYVGMYWLFWALLARKIKLNRCANLDNGYIVLFSTLTVFINIGVSMFRRLEAIGLITKIAENIYAIICCVLVLFLQFSVFSGKQLQYELDAISYMWERDREQYKLRKEYIDAINIKCHDLKHVVHTLRQEASPSYLAEMEKAVSLYDSMVRTGNEALDVILSEKSLYCAGHDIRFTCMIDGRRLNFIDDADIYSCMGNALDNAIEAASTVQESEKRVVALSMKEESAFLCIHVENWFNGKIQMKNGFPCTTKQDKTSHGFGVKSMTMIAEKYGGNVTFSAEDGIFSLNIFFPCADAAEKARETDKNG